jgi:hypothetical protein
VDPILARFVDVVWFPFKGLAGREPVVERLAAKGVDRQAIENAGLDQLGQPVCRPPGFVLVQQQGQAQLDRANSGTSGQFS